MHFPLKFPVKMTFSLFALSNQIVVRDAESAPVMFVKQKMFKLKEEINIFSNDTMKEQIYQIKADKMIDWSATYTATNAAGEVVGAVKRLGMASMWKASYDILDANKEPVLHIREKSVMVRILDGLFGEIPIVGMFTGYLFNPAYLVSPKNDEKNVVMQMIKKPSFMERNFYLEKLDRDMPPEFEEQVVLGLFMVALLERARG